MHINVILLYKILSILPCWIIYLFVYGLSYAEGGYIPAEAKVVLPYNVQLAPESVIQIAEAAAKIRALDEARQYFCFCSIVKMEVRTREKQLALASVLFPVIISNREMHEGPEVVITACCQEPECQQDDRIRVLLKQKDHLYFRELVLRQLEQCTNEGMALISGTACSDCIRDKGLSIHAQIKVISNRIKALQVFFDELNTFEYEWKSPNKTALAFSEATQLDPDNPLIWMGLGECLVLLNRPYEGVKALQKASGGDAFQAKICYMRGVAHLQMGLPALAIQDISKAVSIDEEHPDWWDALGRAKLNSGDVVGMCTDFYKACAMGFCDGLMDVREQNFCLHTTSRQ